jgi:predicted MFS family arabinose efflux permease
MGKRVSGNNPGNGRLGAATQVALLACGMFATIGLFSPGLVLPQIERTFAATPHAELLTQLIGAVASFSFAVGAPFAGALIARLGCRHVIVPSLLLFAIAGTAPALLNDLWSMVATRVVLGLSLSGIFTGGLAGIGAMPEMGRARMFGWFAVVGGAAAILLFPAVGAMARVDWHLAFTVHLVALAILPLAWRLPAALGVVVPHASRDASRGVRAMFTPAMIGLLGLAGFAGMSMFLSPMYSPLYLASFGITDTRLLAIPMTLGSIAAVLASAAYGFLHGRLGIFGLSATMMVVMGLALLLAGSVDSMTIFTMAIVVHSATLALLAPNVSATALAVSQPGLGSQSIGLANGVMFGSQLLFPFIASAIRTATSIAGVFLCFGVVALAIGVSLHAYLRMRRQAPLAAAASSSPPN